MTQIKPAIRTAEGAIAIIEKNGFVDGEVNWGVVETIVRNDMNESGLDNWIDVTLANPTSVINYVYNNWQGTAPAGV